MPGLAFCAAPVGDSALSGTYGASEDTATCSVQITGRTEERFGQTEVLIVWLTLSSSGADLVQLALRMTGDFASRLGTGPADYYERVEGGRIETLDSMVVVSSFSGATRGANGMMEVLVDRLVVSPLVDAILQKTPVKISVKPTWQRSELAFGGIVDLPTEDASKLAQCATKRATSDSRSNVE